MTWVWKISAGTLSDGKQTFHGYAGNGVGFNNPLFCDVPNVGPPPVGGWTLGNAIAQSKLGPVAIPLSPKPDTKTHGRSGFYIHGDRKEHDGCASHGCIVLDRTARAILSSSGDIDLEVVP